MPNSDAENIVDLIMSKDHLGLKDAIDNIMMSKAEDALELRKEYIGQHMFNPASEEIDSDDAEQEQ